MNFRPTLLPTLFTVPALLALLSLGIWQVERLNWKEELIDRLRSRSTAEPVALPRSIDNLESFEFRRVFVTGEFLHKHEFYLFTIRAF